MPRARLIRRLVLFAVLLIAIAGIVAPFINADHFGARIREALERSLGRKVQIGKARFNLFTGPGFTIDDVLIQEDPAYGIEPFAHVQQLDARVGFSSILTGSLSFSKLRLLDPSFNLVRRSEGGWNIVALLDHAVAQQGQQRVTFGLPTVEVRSGHLYFKQDNTKSGFYLTDADVDITPRAGGLRGFDLRFSAGPARTDRSAQSFATVRGRGQFEPGTGGDPSVDLDLELERTGMDELVTLFRGRNFGVHGTLTSRAHVAGPISAMKVAGEVRIDDVHRWDLMLHGGGWNVEYSGLIDWRKQTASVAATQKENPGQPVLPSVQIADFLNKPRWSADISISALPAANLLELARHLGATVPANFAVDGKLSGSVGYAPESGWQGLVTLDNAEVKMAKDTSLKVASSQTTFNGSAVRFGPASVTGPDGQEADVEATWDTASNAFNLSVRAKVLGISEMQADSGHLLTAAPVPFLEGLQHGRWSGTLRYEVREGSLPSWTGGFELRDAIVAVPGMSEPVRMRTAQVQLQGDKVHVTHMRARAGAIELAGDYHYQPGEKRPHQFSLTAPEAHLDEIERLFLPLLRREQGFFARTLRFKPLPPPQWLAGWHAEGSLRIGELTAGPAEVTALRANVVWDGPQFSLVARSARVLEGMLKGTLQVDVSGPAPRYKLTGGLQNASWRDGKVDVDGTLDSRGTGTEWLANLHAKGEFQGRELEVLPDNPVRTASGDFDLTMSADGPLLLLEGIEASIGGDAYTGRATTQAGTLRLELTAAHGANLLFTGPLAPLKLELAESKP